MKQLAKFLIILLALTGPACIQAASFDGTVFWAKKINMSAPVSGRIARINVNPGHEVKKDQLLLQFDQTPFKATVSQAEALLSRQRTLRKAARREYEQAKELYARTVLSTVSLEEAKEKNQRAQADYKAALANLSVAKYQLLQSTLRAPFDGWILATHVSAGETIVNDLVTKPLIVMAEKGQYLARGNFPLKKISSLKIGDKVTVDVGDVEVSGKIISIGLEPLKGKDKQHYLIEVIFNLKSPLLRAGQSVEVETK